MTRFLLLAFLLVPTLAEAQYVDFISPNSASVTHRDLARIMQNDWQALTIIGRNNGVVGGSGCDVTAQGSPNMSVHVSACTISYNGANVAVSAADPSITTAPSAPNVRLDLVTVNGSGTVSVTAGTPAASGSALLPAMPITGANLHIPLGVVFVGSGVTTITSAEIVSKKVPVLGQAPTYGGAVTATEFVSSVGGKTKAQLDAWSADIGTLVICTDCTVGTAACQTGGTVGTLAVRVGGPAWRCF